MSNQISNSLPNNNIVLDEQKQPHQRVRSKSEDSGFPVDWFFNQESPPISPERMSKAKPSKINQELIDLDQRFDKLIYSIEG